ncbi:putative kinase [Nakamurella sp. UYEF19]|uniref:AAA family ATPase n=1 Tax=Nakamurella sp. UYEF19 TaxID=1756392 RepID=UPI0033917C3E
MHPQEQHERSVLVVAGPAGSGKSTLGRSLAAATGGLLLDQDIATNPLMAQLARLVGAGDDLDHPRLRGPVRQARYQCLIDIAVDNGRLGRTVVMVAPFTAESADPRQWAELVRQLSPAPVHLVWVTVPPEVAVARRRRRNLARDRAAALDAVPVATPDPVVPHVAASGSADPEFEGFRVLELLRSQPPAAPEPSPARD